MVRKSVFRETFQLILDGIEGVQDYRVVAVLAGTGRAFPNKDPKNRLHLHSRMALYGSGNNEVTEVSLDLLGGATYKDFK